MPRALKLDKAGKLKLSEADVVRQIEDFMSHRGWRIFLTGYGEIRKGFSTVTGLERVVATVGEEFMADRLFVRYGTGAYCELIWCEMKRPKCAGDRGGKLSKGQKLWLQLEQARGATCIVPDDIVTYMDWYRKTIGAR